MAVSKAEKHRALAKGQGEDGELVKTSTAQLEAEKVVGADPVGQEQRQSID